MANVRFPHSQRHSQRRSRSRLRSSEARTTVSLQKTCPVMSVVIPAGNTWFSLTSLPCRGCDGSA